MHDRLVSLFATVAVGLLAVAVPVPVGAQAQEKSMPRAGSFEAGLDALLAARNYDGLGRAVLSDAKDGETAVRALDWLQGRLIAGGGSLIAFLYSAALWRLGESVPAGEASQLRLNAAAQFTLARWLIQTEGFQCADASAPEARLLLVDRELAQVGRYLSGLAPADREKALNVAFVVLVRGFAARENDLWLCSGGIAQFNKYFEKHPNEAGKETTVPGTVGKTVVLPADPSILPDFVPYADWQARRREALDAIVKRYGLKPVTDYADSRHRMR